MASRKKILCVEDEELILGDLVEELEDAGYESIGACNGLDALEKLKAMRPDLILCDIMMPEMDGPSLLKTIRETMPELSRVPFIFLTARASREDIIEGKRAGADDYLTKPLDFDMLLATVESRLGEVGRMTAVAQQELVKLYQSFEGGRKHKASVKVSIVTPNASLVSPISSALGELGCDVVIQSEEMLKANMFDSEHADVNFLMYSKIMHYWLKYLANMMHAEKSSKVVVLIPATMNKNQREALLELGIDGFIEYPFRPVQVFKVIMDWISGDATPAKKAAPAVKASSSDTKSA